MLGEIWEEILNCLERQDILNTLKSRIFVSTSRLICNMCSYRKQIHISDDIYNLEYIFNYTSGKYNLKSSTCGIYLNGVCDHCSKVRGKLKISKSAFQFHTLRDYLHMEKLLISNVKKNKRIKSHSLPSNLMTERTILKYS